MWYILTQSWSKRSFRRQLEEILVKQFLELNVEYWHGINAGIFSTILQQHKPSILACCEWKQFKQHNTTPKRLGWIVWSAAQMQLWHPGYTPTVQSGWEAVLGTSLCVTVSAGTTYVLPGFDVLPHLPSCKLQYLHIVHCKERSTVHTKNRSDMRGL